MLKGVGIVFKTFQNSSLTLILQRNIITLPLHASHVSHKCGQFAILKNLHILDNAALLKGCGRCVYEFERSLVTKAGVGLAQQKQDPLHSLKLELSGVQSNSRKVQKTEHKNHRLLKVAIIGLPNSGKSTLINQIIGRRACSASKKVHTTRCSARAVFTEEETQIVFLDTPGLVSATESQKHNLERSFLVDPDESVSQADLIAVVHDASNKWTRQSLDMKLLRLLHLNANKDTILILNKTDAVRTKQMLLQMNRLLTENMLAEPGTGPMRVPTQLSEFQLRKLVEDKRSWPYFCEVFMVSALTGDGVNDIREYILSRAVPSPWLFSESTLTDQDPLDIILQAVQEKLLDHLPKELPYLVTPVLQHLNQSEEGFISAIVLLPVAKKNVAKLLLGRGAQRIKQIAQEVEQELQNTFRHTVQVKLIVQLPTES